MMAQAKITLPSVYTDNMVLQQKSTLKIHGRARPNADVTLQTGWSRAAINTKSDARGHWYMEVATPKASCEPYTLLFSDGEDTMLKNVLVGEIWFGSGQSNMDMPLAGWGKVFNYEEEIANANFPKIRLFQVKNVLDLKERDCFNLEYNMDGWQECSPKTVPEFSAVCYFFASQLWNELKIPIGVIDSNWGGTPACAWMDNRYLEGTDGAVWLREFEEATRNLDVEAYQAAFRANSGNDRTHQLENPFNIKIVKEGLTPQEQAQFLAAMPQMPDPNGPWYERRPGGLYETMLKKVHPYAIKGVIWYQGETDEKHPEQYKTVFSRMIRCWRDLWQEELPFLFVQLAPFGQWLACGSENYPTVRESQQWVSKEVPNTWMASIGDAGMQWDIHPKDKLPVGHRLALLARGHVYGQPILCDAPELESAQKRGGQILLRFAHAAGLHKTCDALQAMVGIDASGESREITTARIENDTLILTDCEDICALAFARTGYYEVNLYNAAGIPAKPFEVEL